MSATANRVIGCARSVLTELEHERRLERDPVSLGSRVAVLDRESVRRSSTTTARPELEAVIAAATVFYQRQLRGQVGAEAAKYLQGRGVSTKAIDRWELGYAPDSWEALTTALRKEGFDDDLLLDAGVSGRSRYGRLYDRMRNRIIFPIHDEHGSPRGFAGRLLAGDGPKYLNTPETDLYRKRSLLYGMHLARQRIIEASSAVVVEGYTDAIAAHQAGITNVVATAGTALTEEHLAKLAEVADKVTLAFDGDDAGLLAVDRVAELDRSQLGLQLFLARIPKGQDPAELLAESGTQAFGEVIAQAVPIEHHLIDRILLRYNLDEPEAMARAIRNVRSVLRSASTADVRFHATEYAANRLGRDVEQVAKYIQEPDRLQGRNRRRVVGRSIA